MFQFISNKNNKIGDSFRCDNKKLKRILMVLWGIAILIEIVVATETLICIKLSSDYLNEVFSATCTVAVLGNAILSMLFGIYDKKILGVPFQDVLNHSKIGDEQRFTIVTLTTSIGFALLWYVLGCYTLLFAVLVQNVFLLLFSCVDLWRFLSDKKEQRNTIIEVIHKVDSSKYAVYVDDWFKTLSDGLVPNNKGELLEYCGLFDLVIENAPEHEFQIRTCILRHMQGYFNLACEKLGFVEAYELLCEIVKYAPKETGLATEIALKFLDGLRLKESVDTVDYEVVNIIEQIFDNPKIEDEEKIMYGYKYFCGIFDNVRMSISNKLEQANQVMNYFCDLHEELYGLIKSKIIINLVKHRILCNENRESRKLLFRMLVEALQRKGRFSSDKYYISIISEIYRAFFAFIYLEEGTLTEKYRNDLLELFQSYTDEKDTTPLSFMTLIQDRGEDVSNWLAMDAINFGKKQKVFWDYFSPAMNWKKLVWTMEEATIFAFCVYHTIGNDYDRHPFLRVLESDEYSDEEKIDLCRILVSLYDIGGFNSFIMGRIEQVCELSSIRYKNSVDLCKLEHKYYQEKIIELSKQINEKDFLNSKKSNSEIYHATQALCVNGQVFAYEPTHSLFPGKRHVFSPTYEQINGRFWENAPNRVRRKIREYLNEYVSNQLPIFNLNFRIQGVTALLDALKAEEYFYTNYRYIDDISFGASLRNTPKFKQLSHLIEQIPFDSSRELSGYYFLRRSKIPFNFQMRYEVQKLTCSQSEEYIRHYEDDGMYKIHGYYFDYDYAIKYAMENVVIENVAIFINVGLDSEDGFKIRFQR